MKKQKYIKNNFIPVNRPVLAHQSKRNVKSALKEVWLSSSGPFVKKFEDNFSAYIGTKFGISVSSGTAALHVALMSLGIKPSDEVMVPAFTMAATWLSILYVGAIPVFIDCELSTYNIDVAKIEAKITKKTKAIMAVHIYGQPCEMKEIISLAKRHKLFVIEDAAESHGAIYNNKRTGSLGDIGCFSFFANKIIATGEGGMIVTDDSKLAERARRFRDLCHSANKRFIHDDIGYNYRITNLQAAVGLGELENIGTYLKKKRRIAKLYGQALKKIPGIDLPTNKPGRTCVFWMYGITINAKSFGLNRDKVRKILFEKYKIETRDFFYGPDKQPILKKFRLDSSDFPNTNLIEKTGLYLPSGLGNTEKEIRRVINAIKEIRLRK